jgi:hypothetical protein
VLNYAIAMSYILAWMIALGLILPSVAVRPARQDSPTGAPTGEPPVALLTPASGQALQGLVAVTGRLPSEGFRSAELSFTYDQDPRQTWFLLAQFTDPLDGKLVDWDTTLLTDGEYVLRLHMELENGEQAEVTIPGLRVRNYSPVETDTPAPTPSPKPGETPLPTPSPLPTDTPHPPTPTPLPPNPASISGQDIRGSLLKGALIAVGGLALLGLYSRLRSAASRRRSSR